MVEISDRPVEVNEGADNSCRSQATPFNVPELLDQFSQIVRRPLDVGESYIRPDANRCQLRPEPNREGDITIDAATRNSVIDNLIKGLRDNYIFPNIADQISNSLLSQSFNHITSGVDLAKALGEHLRSAGMDKHLDVSFSRDVIPDSQNGDTSGDQLEEILRMQREENSGVARAEMFGNTGILKIDSLWPISDSANPEGARLAIEAINAAMAKLAGAENLIIDLRDNGGGDPATVAHILSHILPPDTHVNSIIWRHPSPDRPDASMLPEGGYEQQFRTQDLGVQSPNQARNIFVLTSCRTFSGGEELAYDLQALGRATIIGEVTGGGANPGEGIRLGPHFTAFIPTGRAVNPITGTNWEGVGVKPDIEVPSDQALAVALARANRR